MKDDLIYTYISAEQALELDTCMRHPALELEELSFVGFISSSDVDLADLFVRFLRAHLRFPIEEIWDKRTLNMAYRKGDKNTVFVVRCDCFESEELMNSVYPSMLIYRDFIFERNLKHFYIGDARFIESATKYMPDLFLVNNVVLQLTNIRRQVEDDIVTAKSLTGKVLIPEDSKVDLMLWLGQRAFNVLDGKGKVLKLNKLRAKSNAYAKSFIYTDLSSLQITLNNEKEAMNCLDKAGKYSDQIKNRNFKQTVVLQKALLYVNQREWERAEFEMKSLIGQFMAGDSISIIIAAYNLLAYSLIKQYKVEEANHAVRYALQESIASGDVLAKATSLWLLGDINSARGRYVDARKSYRDSLSFYTSRQKLPQVAYNLLRLGDSYKDIGEYYFARMYYQAALELYTYRRLNYGKALSLRGLALIDMALDQLDSAKEDLLESIKLFVKERSPYDQGYSEVCLGECFLLEGRLQDADYKLEEASGLLECEWGKMMLSRLRGLLLMRTCDYDRASRYLKEALFFFKRIDDKSNRLSALIDMGELCYCQVDLPSSLSFLQEALDLTNEYQIIPSRIRIYEILAKVYDELGEPDKAMKYKTLCQRIQALLQLLQELNK